MAFDPCREWLGIDAVDLGEPTRVLGLPPGCRDAAAIAAAAEARLEALRRVTPGPFAKAHAALVARVEEARDTLLATAFTGGGASPPRDQASGGFSPPPPPGGIAAGRWQAPADEPVVSLSPAGFPPAADSAEPAFDAAVRRTVVRPRSSSNAGGLLLTSLALLATAVAVIVFLMLRPDPFGSQVAVKQPPTGTTGSKPNGAKPSGGGSSTKPGPNSATRPPEPPTSGGTSPTPEAAEREARDADRRREAMAREASEREQEEAERRRRKQAEQARREAEMANQKPGAETTGQQTADQKADQKAEEMAKQQAAAEEARRREAMAAEEAKQATDEERLKMQAALDKSLGEAFKALQRGEFDTADRTIKAAEPLVGDDVEAATRIERWRLLATYAREFVRFREQAIAAANAGGDYEVDGKRFAVIEITPEMFVYKAAGAINRVPRDQVNPRIELAVVEGWFAADGRAANHLFLGARWLCLDPPNLQQARREWQIAGDGGEQVAPLNALLDDPVVRRAAR